MLKLIAPTTDLRDSWLDARAEWGTGVHQDGSGQHITDDVDSVDGFAVWVERLRRQADESIPVAPDRVHATYWWIVEQDVLLGAISLRHRLNEFLLRGGGHIGYGVRPSARRRGGGDLGTERRAAARVGAGNAAAAGHLRGHERRLRTHD